MKTVFFKLGLGVPNPWQPCIYFPKDCLPWVCVVTVGKWHFSILPPLWMGRKPTAKAASVLIRRSLNWRKEFLSCTRNVEMRSSRTEVPHRLSQQRTWTLGPWQLSDNPWVPLGRKPKAPLNSTLQTAAGTMDRCWKHRARLASPQDIQLTNKFAIWDNRDFPPLTDLYLPVPSTRKSKQYSSPHSTTSSAWHRVLKEAVLRQSLCYQ